MVINSVQLNTAGNSNVIPMPKPKPTGRGYDVALKSQNQSFGASESQNDSFLYKIRGLAGFIAGVIIGDVVCRKFVIPKFKNPTWMKDFGTSLLMDLSLGYLFQAVVEKVTEKKN